MQLANITLCRKKVCAFTVSVFLIGSSIQAQDNSPYSRYGLGNEFPRTNIANRGMGGISAAYADVMSVNYSNPASYSAFQAIIEQRSRKVAAGRVILDVGLNLSSRKLTEPNTTNSFTSSDALFSHVYVGIPIRKNWGLSFGIRPLSRVTYDIIRTERLFNPNPPNGNIDSAVTQFTGTGGSFLPTIGTGFGSDHFSVGFNIGYLFGKKEIATRRALLNDSVQYAASNHTTNTSFGNIFFNAGFQYTDTLKRFNQTTNTPYSMLRFGVSGNWKQTINGSQDILRQTYVRNASGQELQVDSVFQQSDVKGEIIYPASFTAGFYYEKGAVAKTKKLGWGIGLDYTSSQWQNYRFFGATDLVQNSWEARLGGQLIPYLLNKWTYRFGAFAGKDYINTSNKNLPVYGVSLGVGIPILPNRQTTLNQFSMINLALEYSQRGNDQNQLKESLLRFSVGLNFTDLWFGKRRYD